MKRSLKELLGYRMEAVDGFLGLVRDFYFDDIQWRIRYLAVDTTGWRPGGRQVLLSPPAFAAVPEMPARHFQVRLTRSEILSAPEIDPEHGLGRREEEQLAEHYRWPAYWAELINPVAGAPERRQSGHSLRRVKDVLGFSVETRDGLAGHVEDLMVAIPEWRVSDIAVRTGGLIPRQLLWTAPETVREGDWLNRNLYLDLPLRDLEGEPPGPPESPYDQGEGINRQF